MRKIIASVLVLAISGGAALAEMQIALGAPWDGKRIPKGQHCSLQGGKGATPPMRITGLPAGTAMVVVEYNDKSYAPLSSKGGHGIIGFPVKGSSADLPSVPGMTDRFQGGIRLIAKARSTGKYASDGYLPPCSGGRGNDYRADVKAIGQNGAVLEKVTVKLGRY
jgi:hypothetical protein